MSVSTGAETGYLDVDGGRLYFEVEGRGDPLLLIHAGVANLRMRDEQVPIFAEQHRVIRYDTRGFGRTTTEDVPYSNRRDIRQLLDHLGVERAAVLGISRGGSIATDFTLEFPERVWGLILVAAGLGGLKTDPAPEMAALWDEEERLYERKEWEKLVDLEVGLWGDGPGQPEGRMAAGPRQRLREMGLQNYRAEQPEGAPQVLDPPAAGRLGEIRVPTLVMWGDLDEPGVLAAGERLSSEIAGARRHVFQGVAHMVNMERPQEFNQLVLEFLAEAAQQRGASA